MTLRYKKKKKKKKKKRLKSKYLLRVGYGDLDEFGGGVLSFLLISVHGWGLSVQ
jgi:hypothetical protein